MNDQLIVLFDGVCKFCDSSVQFIIRRDPNRRFVFAPLQSGVGKELRERFQWDGPLLDTMVLIEGHSVYTQSTAALRIAKRLNRLWPGVFALIIVPVFIRDAVYRIVARNRYRWFGKHETCLIPTPEIRDRFIG